MTDAPKPTLTEAERESLLTFDTGNYACAAEGYCSGYDHSLPGHDHEDIYDVVARIKAAARREALLEAAEKHRHEVFRVWEEGHATGLRDLQEQLQYAKGLGIWAEAPRDTRNPYRAALAEPERDEEGR
ncbi:MAG TPA: hypothetical protein VIQ11_01380 [Mycobacterium sp.]